MNHMSVFPPGGFSVFRGGGGGGGGAPAEAIAPIATNFANVYVWDATEDAALYELNPDDDTYSIYSMTKLLTALTLLDFASNLSDTVTIVAGDLAATPLWMPLQVNDVISYNDLLKGMIIHEAGDASKAICRVIGDLAYAAAGNTGTSGFTRGMEEISAKATALGLTSLTLTTPGGYEQFTNTGSARDIAKLAWLARQDATIQPLTVTASGSATVTGVNARTITLTDPAPYGRANTVLDHVGFYEDTFALFYRSNYAIIWGAPNGSEVVFVGQASNSDRTYHNVDMDKLRNAAVRDFTYLDPLGTMSPTDADFASVQFLLGAETAIEDESSTPETVTSVGTVTRVSSPRLMGTHSVNLAAGNSYIEASLPHGGISNIINTNNFTIEMFLRIDNGGAAFGGARFLMGQWGTVAAEQSWIVYLSDNALFLQANNSGGGFEGAWQLNTTAREWAGGSHHLVVQRNSGGIRRLFFNGRATTIGSSVNWLTPTTGMFFGNNFSPVKQVDEIRISTVARYATGGWAVGSENGAVAPFPRS